MADGIMTPSGSGGLLRYNEEYNSKFQMKPEVIIVLIAVVIVGMTLIKLFLK